MLFGFQLTRPFAIEPGEDLALTLTQVLRHKSVEKCVMVDIDGDVVEFCRKASRSSHPNPNPNPNP